MSSITSLSLAIFACFVTLLALNYWLLAAVNEKETLRVLQARSEDSRARDRGTDVGLSDAIQRTPPSDSVPATHSAAATTFQPTRTVEKTTAAKLSENRRSLPLRQGATPNVAKFSSVQDSEIKYNQTHITRQVLVQERIQRTCQAISFINSSPSLSPWQRSHLLKHLVVDDRTHLLYCYVPKVGCANWKRVFSILYGNHYSVENIPTVNHSSMKLLNSYSDHEISYRLKNYFKFMFVRHPMDRLLSAYRNKFGEHFQAFEAKYGAHIVKHFRPNPPEHPKGNDVTFAEFLAYVASTENSLLNEHWSPYVDLCQPCFVDYDYIGHFEFLEEDALFLLSTLKLDKIVHYPKKQSYYHPVTEEDKVAYFEGSPSKVLQDVITKFALDFQMFGYQPHFIGTPQTLLS